MLNLADNFKNLEKWKQLINLFKSILVNTIANILASLILLAVPILNSTLKTTNMNSEYFTSSEFIVNLLIGIFLVIQFNFCRHLLKTIETQKTQIKVLNIIHSWRNRFHFLRYYDGLKFSQPPMESNENFHKRTPQGQYEQRLLNEFEEVKTLVVEALNMKPTDADKLLKELYFSNEPNKTS